eukprot:GHVT01015430.1.p1 GENE.GHVT01015430.1~~GHVT01015430.1.p1  ORF type:complete len:494 (-),score=157.53 GHVT01015430.1:540-2021(-)
MHVDRRSLIGSAVFDKDDELAVDFVTAAANLRMANFHIAPQSRWSIQAIAGAIIPAIASTNAMVAAVQVQQLLHVLSFLAARDEAPASARLLKAHEGSEAAPGASFKEELPTQNADAAVGPPAAAAARRAADSSDVSTAAKRFKTDDELPTAAVQATPANARRPGQSLRSSNARHVWVKGYAMGRNSSLAGRLILGEELEPPRANCFVCQCRHTAVELAALEDWTLWDFVQKIICGAIGCSSPLVDGPTCTVFDPDEAEEEPQKYKLALSLPLTHWEIGSGSILSVTDCSQGDFHFELSIKVNPLVGAQVDAYPDRFRLVDAPPRDAPAAKEDAKAGPAPGPPPAFEGRDAAAQVPVAPTLRAAPSAEAPGGTAPKPPGVTDLPAGGPPPIFLNSAGPEASVAPPPPTHPHATANLKRKPQNEEEATKTDGKRPRVSIAQPAPDDSRAPPKNQKDQEPAMPSVGDHDKRKTAIIIDDDTDSDIEEITADAEVA